MMANNHIIIQPQIISTADSIPKYLEVEPFEYTPTKICFSEDHINWRKGFSAFKKYRQRKSKKQAHEISQNYQDQYQFLEFKKQKFLRFTIYRSKEQKAYLNCQQDINEQTNYCYFDPSQAPLYIPENEQNEKQMKQMLQIQAQKEKSIEQMKQVSINQRQQKLKEFILPQLPDDPFYIIKYYKEESQFNRSVNHKSKLIRKQIKQNKSKLSSKCIINENKLINNKSLSQLIEQKSSLKDENQIVIHDKQNFKQIKTLIQILEEAQHKQFNKVQIKNYESY